MSAFQVKESVWKTCAFSAGLVVLLGIAHCTYEPLAPPQVLHFYQTINLPLTDVNLPLADLVDSTNHILGDPVGDSLYFYFAGPLDTVTLTPSLFQVPGGVNLNIRQQFGDLNQSLAHLDTTINQTIKLSQVLPLPAILPASQDITIDSVGRQILTDERREIRVFDPYNIPYFTRVVYLTIESGTFQTIVENQLLVDLDSVQITFRNKNGSVLAQTLHIKVPAGTTQISGIPGNLDGRRLYDSVEVVISAIVAGTDRQPLTIPAGTDPFVTIGISLDLESVESFTGEPQPIVLTNGAPLPPSRNTILQAELASTQTEPRDTNFMMLEMENTLPFDLGVTLTFLNFYRETQPLVIDTLIESGKRVDVGKRLDGYIFRAPEPGTVVDSVQVLITVQILPPAGEEWVTIPLDLGGRAMGVDFGLGTLAFHSLDGFLNETFSIPPMTISNIPTGFTDVEFGSVILVLHFYNQIRARTDIALQINGYRTGYPSVVTRSEGTIRSATLSEPITHSSLFIDIAEIFNLVPDSIIAQGQAIFPSSDTSHLEVGNSFWGTFEIRVPFQMKIKPLTMIPVSSSRLSPIDRETKRRIEAGLIEANILTQVINDFPIAGEVDILMSNYDYFPLSPDSADSGYIWIKDTLYAQTDTGLVAITIDTLARVELPAATLDAQGRVSEPGFVYQRVAFDSVKMAAILREEEHFIRPRIYLPGTDGFVQIGYWDRIQITSLLQLKVNGGKLLDSDEEEEPAPAPTLPKNISTNQQRQKKNEAFRQ